MTRISWVYDRLLDGLGYVAGLLIAAAALGITADVITRETGLGSNPWMLESVEYALFLATFVGAPWALRLGAHVSVDVVIRVVPRRAKRIADLFANMLGLITMGFLLYYAVFVMQDAKASGMLVIKEFIFPEWWKFALMTGSFILILIEFVVRLICSARGIPRGETGLGGGA
jgi:TRAP-type C4-dicarboxylate transport system permease small subunit